MTHANVHRSERIRRVPTSMLPPRSSGPVAEGTLPLFSRWHRSGNLLEPLEPGELVSHQAGPRHSDTRLRRGTRPTFVGRVSRGQRGHRASRTRRPTDLVGKPKLL